MSCVSIQSTPNYDLQTVLGCLREHFAALSLQRHFAPGKKVLIKPNLIMKRDPSGATTTHPALVKGVILLLQEYGVQDILVADSPGGLYTAAALKSIYKTTGMEEAVFSTVASCNYDTGYEKISCEGTLVHEFQIIRPVLEADIIINLAKLKTHCMTVLSGGVKNLFGCVPGLLKPEFHMRFPEKEAFSHMLLDLASAVAPQITFIDAVEAMEGDGPTGGSKKFCGLTLCSEDVFALDLVCSEVLGFSSAQIPTVYLAAKRGLGPENLSQVRLVGDGSLLKQAGKFRFPSTKQTDFSSRFPTFLRPAAQWGAKKIRPKPVIHTKKCVGCGKCAESCPAHTIELRAGKAVILPQNCIYCFCCHEMCPYKAVEIRRLRLFNR